MIVSAKTPFRSCILLFMLLANSSFGLSQEPQYIVLVSKENDNITFFEEGEEVIFSSEHHKHKGIITEISHDSIFLDSVSFHINSITKISSRIVVENSSYRGTTHLISGGILISAGALLTRSSYSAERLIGAVALIGGTIVLATGIYSYFNKVVYKKRKGFNFSIMTIDNPQAPVGNSR